MSKELFLTRYSKAINEGYAAVFSGAGFSKSVGYVDWRTLLKPFADELSLDINQETNLARLAQYYRNEMFGRSSINQAIVEQFSQDKVLNDNIKIVTRLPIYTYWTTNYDKLLERGLELNERKADVKIESKQLVTHKRDRDAVVYKMHGDVDFPDEAVLTKEDFEVYNEKRGLFTTVLQGDLISKTFLFVGFSFDDPNLDYILSRTRILSKGKTGESFWLEKRVEEPDISDHINQESKKAAEEEYRVNKVRQNLKINELKRYGISTVLIDDYSEITSLLKELERRNLKKNIFISGSIENFNENWSKDKVEDFCFSLSNNLIKKGYKIHSGFGLGVGSSVINGALEEIYKAKYKKIDEHLSLRPFPQNISDYQERQEKYRQYRNDILSDVGVSIFIFGNKEKLNGKNDNISGMLEEFSIAKEKNNLIIPVGSTGEISSQILNEIKKNIEDYPYLEKSIGILENNLSTKKLIDEIIKIIEEN
ncbi:SIR2 family protein [Enterococcus casseliflavus]|uniref:SIR2 family protein n=2 Tax=Enterococcus casseliflavus TaxID=37734 RepID=UPI0039A60764